MNDYRFDLSFFFHLLIYFNFLDWLIVFLARFIHSIVFRLIRLMSIIVFNAENDLLFIIESTKLLLSWIHFISVISHFLYDCFRVITFIINRFSTVIFSRVKQSYKDLLSMTSIREMRMLSIFVKIAFNIESTSKSWIIANNSIAKTLRVIRLYFIENQCKIFVVLIESAKQMT
jgi:hypothetical protein